VLAGTHTHIGHLIKHQRDAVRINSIDGKGKNTPTACRISGAKEMQAFDVTRPLAHLLIKQRFVLLDGIETNGRQILQRCPQAKEARIILQTGLKNVQAQAGIHKSHR